MAISANLIRRPSDRAIVMTLAAMFPLVVFVGYFKTYYLKTLFDVPSIANNLVHVHALVMTAWVIYFVVQVALVRTKNLKLHMTIGMAGVALAALVIIVGAATAYDSQLVRNTAPPGSVPHEFFIIPMADLLMFAIFFGGAIYLRKRPAEHKSLMMLTAINFMPPALARMPFVVPESSVIFAGIVGTGIGLMLIAWHTWKHRKLNVVFASGFVLLIASVPVRIVISHTATWHRFTAWLAP